MSGIHRSTEKSAPPPAAGRAEGAHPAVVAFLDHLQHGRGRSPATSDRYLAHLERVRAWLLEDGTELLEASAEQLEECCGLRAHQAGISPRGRRPMVAAVRGFFAWAKRRGLVREHPAENLPYPRFGRPLPSPIGLKHAEALVMAPGIATFLGVRDTALMMVLMGCGLRVSGLVAMNEGDLLFERDAGGRELLTLRVREKGNAERLVPADDETRMMLRAYLGHHELLDMDRALENGDQVLWVSTMSRHVPAHEYRGDARRLSAQAVHEIIQRRGEQAGIPERLRHPHALRHLYGTELAESGVDVLGIGALMGHRSPSSSQVYVHLAARKLRQLTRGATPTSKIRTPVSDLVRELHHPR